MEAGDITLESSNPSLLYVTSSPSNLFFHLFIHFNRLSFSKPSFADSENSLHADFLGTDNGHLLDILISRVKRYDY